MNAFVTYVTGRIALAAVISQAVAKFVDVLKNGACSTEGYAAENQIAVAEQVTVSECQQALTIRAAWMKRMRLEEREIEILCKDDGGPVDLQEEIENLQAAYRPKQIPSYDEMKILVDRVAPSKIAERDKSGHLR